MTSLPPSEIEQTFGSKLWRLTNLYKIRTKDKELVPFRFNDIQERIYRSIQGQTPIRQFYLKYRQGGVSTFWLLWWLDATMFNANTLTGILANSWENLQRLWRIIEVAFENLPPEFRPRKKRDQAHRLEFAGSNSEIFISLSVRAAAVNNLHISEWCFCDDKEIEATLGACGPQTNITGESTPNGVGNSGYLTYQDAKQGRSDFQSHFYPWFIQQEYAVEPGVPLVRTAEERKIARRAMKEYGITLTDAQMNWRRMKKATMPRLFQQEYPSDDEEAFLATGGRFFDCAKMMALLEEARARERTHPPVKQTEDYTQWEEPDPTCNYVAGADTAEGGGNGDYSVLTILNVTKQTTAFRFRAHVGIDVFYRVCDEWGRKFNNAWLAIEKNNHGHSIIQGLVENSRYPNLFVQQKAIRYREPTQILFDPTDRMRRTGWTTDAASKPLMLDALKLALEGPSDVDVEHFETEFTVPDVLLLEETLKFVQVGGSLGAESGSHDDLVMAYAIANQLFSKTRVTEGRQNWGIMVSGKRSALDLDRVLGYQS
ncbi:MAG: hypothetical protein A2992_06815 [Elusimicrobia bacterium RIFCSPLOWO2_01_FULL_59_12]|nr:MAG: hypothetical protein A2992_06815 [Elusimicrobia bacterium RIFCSPLOWO2_01_FULL_59_12]